MHKSLPVALLLIAIGSPGVLRAEDQAVKPPEPAVAPAAQPVKPAQASPADDPKNQKPEPKVVAPTPDPKKPTFVDKDGDGIRDGQQHRFRGRHQLKKQEGGSGQQGQGCEGEWRNRRRQHQGGR